ncbi:hypothetical protein [Janthinobacterium sp. PC23-8]|uniref:hypothetical protein n=1 Tax=Janthinobacterium sp. PC23-8 TaxID=2012679 RepID=UPI0011400FC9|nr:hypothetical protein [Janthinobacterium sp. PC23-8]
MLAEDDRKNKKEDKKIITSGKKASTKLDHPLPIDRSKTEILVKNEKTEAPRAPRYSSDHPLEKVIQDYLANMRDILQTVNIVMPHLTGWFSEEIAKAQKSLSRFFPDDVGHDEDITLEKARDFAEFTGAVKNIDDLINSKAVEVLARSLFMQMFCEFDAFTGLLLKAVYGRNSELLKGISREISLSDLLAYPDIDAVKQAMLDKEIETFRRDSYVEQFAQLEKKFNLTLRKFSEWPEFVELSQRRNIFTHNDGMINDQYISVCTRESYVFVAKPEVGQVLEMNFEYFARATQVMSKLGYMLCHTLWSKIFPGEANDLHSSLNNSLYSCLEDKRWKTAAELGEFSLSEPMKKNISDIDLRIRVINVSIALKFSDRFDDARKILNSIDWTATYRDFKLALHVLNDRFDEAVELMKSIGKNGEIIDQHSYHAWPLFHKFKERPEFYATYESIYGDTYFSVVPSTASTTEKEAAAVVNSGVKKARSKKGSAFTLPPTAAKKNA